MQSVDVNLNRFDTNLCVKCRSLHMFYVDVANVSQSQRREEKFHDLEREVVNTQRKYDDIRSEVSGPTVRS